MNISRISRLMTSQVFRDDFIKRALENELNSSFIHKAIMSVFCKKMRFIDDKGDEYIFCHYRNKTYLIKVNLGGNK